MTVDAPNLTAFNNPIEKLNKVIELYKLALLTYGNSRAQKDDRGIKHFGEILRVVGNVYYKYLDGLLKSTKIVMILDNDTSIVLDNPVDPGGLSIMLFKQPVESTECSSRSIHILAIKEFKLGEN